MVLLSDSTSTRSEKEGVPQLTKGVNLHEVVNDHIIHTSSYHITLHLHLRPAGSGFHLPSSSHTVVILLAGANPGLHLKIISAPSVVFWYVSMEPFVGKVGSLQLTVGKKVCSKQLNTRKDVHSKLLYHVLVKIYSYRLTAQYQEWP